MKPFTKIAAVIFGIAAAVHIYRLVSPFSIVIGGNAKLCNNYYSLCTLYWFVERIKKNNHLIQPCSDN